jgi:NAD-dependent SIR2 family protein deacetylase
VSHDSVGSDNDRMSPDVAATDDDLHETVPTCPHCGRIARPDVVLFGERLRARKMRASIHAARHADVWIAVKTSGTVFPAAGLIDFYRPGTVRILVNAQPWIDNSSKFGRHVLGDAATAIGDVLREVVSGRWRTTSTWAGDGCGAAARVR